jgi:hypothetical protein
VQTLGRVPHATPFLPPQAIIKTTTRIMFFSLVRGRVDSQARVCGRVGYRAASWRPRQRGPRIEW